MNRRCANGPLQLPNVTLTGSLAVIQGWSAPFIGEHHVALASNIRNMYYGTSARSAYMGHAAVIQSSGSGKSRLVHEVAREIFTIPFNIRDPKEHINSKPHHNFSRALILVQHMYGRWRLSSDRHCGT